jgi:ATP synthase protein I
MTDRNADRWVRNGFEDEEQDRPVKALTREEAGVLRATNPSVSPWRVVFTQLAVGAVVALLAGWASGTEGSWSALYGTATAVVPGALMARGVTSGLLNVSPGASAVGVMFWSLVKIGVSVLMLVLAPRVVQPLSWPALLVALVLCIQVYWFALLWRGRR